jgi:hypothetical protein
MTFVTLGNGCGGLAACYGFRGVIVSGLEAGDGVWANMLVWLDDFDCSTVPWGYIQSNTFSNPSLTAPDNSSSGGQPVNSSNPGPLAFSQWFVIDNNGDPFAEPNGVKCQVSWPAGSAYGVFAVDAWNAYQTGHICCTGTTGACGASIIEINRPNPELPGPIPWNRLHYVAELGLTPANIDAVYAAQLAFGVAANYGPNWNVNKICFPTPIPGTNDPFDDAAP